MTKEQLAQIEATQKQNQDRARQLVKDQWTQAARTLFNKQHTNQSVPAQSFNEPLKSSTQQPVPATSLSVTRVNDPNSKQAGQPMWKSEKPQQGFGEKNGAI
jgi:hypothetical protein